MVTCSWTPLTYWAVCTWAGGKIFILVYLDFSKMQLFPECVSWGSVRSKHAGQTAERGKHQRSEYNWLHGPKTRHQDGTTVNLSSGAH